MKRIIAGTALAFLCLVPAVAEAGNHRLGAGATYWVSLDDLRKEGFDRDGLSWFISYQYRPGLLGVEAALEVLPDLLGEDTVAPQGYVILGGSIYAAAGMGVLYYDSTFADRPFFALKAGFDLDILPFLRLDLSANYRFSRREDLRDSDRNIDFNTVYLGAALRLAL